MIEISARNPRTNIVACGKPDLSPAPGVQIVGSSRTSHLGWHPPRFERIRKYFGPTTCDGKSQQNIVKLRIGIGCHALPRSTFPSKVLEAYIAALVQPGT